MLTKILTLKGRDSLEQEEFKLIKGLAAIKDDYEFAELSPNEFEEINDVERKFNQGKNREIVILAYEKKKPDLT